jgi:hypothetical protein
MKKIIHIFNFVFVSATIFAQTNEPSYCMATSTLEFNTFRQNPLNNTVIDNPLTPLVLNVRINVFNNAQGENYFTQNGLPFGENEFMEVIKILNTTYNQYNIFFKYLGHKFYNSDLTYVNEGSLGSTFFYMSDLCDKDAININFVQQCSTPTSPLPNGIVTTHSNSYQIGWAQLGKPMLLISMPAYNGVPEYGNGSYYDATYEKEFMVCHEMGHVLGLKHVYENADGAAPGSPLGTPTCEHVTRIPSNSNYNATAQGDWVHDTPAQRIHSSFEYQKGGAFDGTLIPNTQPAFLYLNYDCEGTLFDFQNTTYGNFMSRKFKYNPTFSQFFPNNQTLFFTPGQGQNMRNYILNPTAGVPGESLQYVMNTVESLYQPYNREYVPGEVIISITDNGNGTANVCRNVLAEDKFQMGFTYAFPTSQSPDTISATTSEVPIVSQHTSSYPVTIAQLAPGQTNLTTNTGDCFLSCTRGQICNDENYIKGMLISTQNLLSLNVNIEELNEIRVKDPDLYNSLMSQYYYKLIKETETGAKTEQVFYKQ